MKAQPTNLRPEELLSHLEGLQALAYRLVRNATAAEDLVQETLLAALENPPKGGFSPGPWLARVARNRATDRLRESSRRTARERDASVDEALPSPEELVERAEQRRILVEAVTALEEPYRSVLLLRYVEGYTPKVIARRSGVPSATVRTRLKRAHDRLREHLDAEFGDRRGWCSALLPLALSGAKASPKVGSLTSVLAPWLAMHASLKLILGTTVLLALSSALWFRFGPAEGATPSPPESDSESAKVVLEDLNGIPEAPNTDVDTPWLGSVPGEDPSGRIEPESDFLPLRGQVVDKHTGRPVPNYGISLRTKTGTVERLESDAHGEFTCTGIGEDEAVEVSMLEHEDMEFGDHEYGVIFRGNVPPSASFEGGRNGAPLVVRVEVGPRFELDLQGNIAASDGPWHATLFCLKPELLASIGPISGSRAPVRPAPTEGGLPWVRFLPPQTGAVSAPFHWALHVRSEGGLWRGEVELQHEDLHTLNRVSIPMERGARLLVTLSSDCAGPIVDGYLTLTPELPSVLGALKPRPLGSSASIGHLPGHVGEVLGDPTRWMYALEGLAPGEYTLTGTMQGAEARKRSIRLGPGELLELDLVLDCHANSGDLVGELRSSSGTFDGQVIVTAEHVERGDGQAQPVEWVERNGALVAPFRFPDVPAGTYRVRIVEMNGVHDWLPASFDAVVPGEDVVLECLDDVETEGIRFLAVHAETGEPIPSFQIALDTGHFLGIHARGVGGRSEEDLRLPVGAQFTWRVRAEGFVPSFGNADALRVVEGVPTIRTELVPGWGARITLLDASGRVVQGAKILLDGSIAATTDGEGQATLFHPSQPLSFEIHDPEAVVFEGDLDGDTGLPLDLPGGAVLRLDR